MESSVCWASPRGMVEMIRWVDRGNCCPGAGICEWFADSSIDAGSGDDFLFPLTGHSDALATDDVEVEGGAAGCTESLLRGDENQRVHSPGFEVSG